MQTNLLKLVLSTRDQVVHKNDILAANLVIQDLK